MKEDRVYITNGTDEVVIINGDTGKKVPNPIFVLDHKGTIIDKKEFSKRIGEFTNKIR